MANLELEPIRRLSTFRRLALGTWRTAYDPSVYGSLTLRMDPALAYIDAFRTATGKRLTIRETPVARDDGSRPSTR
jgi:pyruvate dehydrogenase E2 component (dihydrolipoamide acetyltransferase)